MLKSDLVCPKCHRVLNFQDEVITCKNCDYQQVQQYLGSNILNLRPMDLENSKLCEDKEIRAETTRKILNSTPWGHLGLKYHIIREAEKMLPLFLKSSDYNILEVGCGSGWLSGLIALHSHFKMLTSSDISPFFLNFSNAVHKVMDVDIGKIRKIALDAEQTPFANDTFDIIIGSECLHHFPNLDKALYEMHRIVKPGGKVYFIYEPFINPFLWKFYYPRSNFSKKSKLFGVTERVLTMKEIKRVGKLFRTINLKPCPILPETRLLLQILNKLLGEKMILNHLFGTGMIEFMK